MADSIEIRLDQLTDAIKGLYAKSSMSQGEIYNALTSLSQRYENLTNVSGEKIAQTLVDEFRKTIDLKYGQTNQFIKDLENSLKNFMTTSANQNPRMAAEITKLLNDTSNIYTKINAQEASLQKVFIDVEKLAKDGSPQEQIAALSENFNNFSSNFENITITLNKNFAEFLSQIRQSSSKEQFEAFLNDLKTINNNVNSIISTISSIDTKCRDLANITPLISGLSSEIKDIQLTLSGQMSKYQSEFNNFLGRAKDDMNILLNGLGSFKKDINEINMGNLRVLKEPLERAMEELKNQDLGRNIQALSDNLRIISQDIQNSMGNIYANLDNLNANSGVQLLNQIVETIPSIESKIEVFKNNVILENSSSLSELKTSILESLNIFKDDLNRVIEKIESDVKISNVENLDTIKLDLQRFSDCIVKNVESLNEKTTKDFDEIKANILDFVSKQAACEEKLTQDITSSAEAINQLSIAIKDSSSQNQDLISEIKNDVIENLSDIARNNEDVFEDFKNKLDKIANVCAGDNFESIADSRSIKDTIEDIEVKIDRSNLQQIHNAKELLEEIQTSNSDLMMRLSSLEESKDVSNLVSAIGSVSEKLQDIKSVNEDLSSELRDTKEQIEQRLRDNIQKLSALLQDNRERKELEQNSNIDELSKKVQEYLSNFEYLKGNISQEIKENLSSEFSKLQTAIKRIRTTDENSNYSYTLEDVESDLAKMRMTLEKNSANNDDFRALFERVVELRAVGLENVKISKDTESELAHMTSWFKDAIKKIDDISNNLTDFQNTGFEDLKTRLVQSEKSKNSSSEVNSRVEGMLKLLAKNLHNHGAKIEDVERKIELISQTQQEGFNPAQFIDIFYENMSQTKMLSNRIEIIEDKINSIQTAMEKLISYVEQ